tara:strand:+ start:177 stop:1001 length:825 start_codon:yes stop_codon:yes gene_type:complete
MQEAIKKLNKAIDKIELITQKKGWIDSLDPRKKEEAEFHDFSHDHSVNLSNKKFYTTTMLSSNFLDKYLNDNVKDKIFLDYACGNGVTSNEVIKYGASFVIGIDISKNSINNAKNLAIKNGYEKKSRFFVGDCENTSLPDNCIDIILCAGMLHHLNLDYAYPEMYRILKPGGKIIAQEALNYNPIIRLYRMRTPEMRTEWEKHHILSLKDVNAAKKYFKVKQIKYFHLSSYLASFFGSPKWMLIILNFFDQIFTKIPIIQLLSWQFIFELEKKK